MSCQSRFDARYWMLGAGALGRPRGMVQGGRREKDSGWGTRVYLWRTHVDIWQNQYNIVKLKKKLVFHQGDDEGWLTVTSAVTFPNLLPLHISTPLLKYLFSPTVLSTLALVIFL